MWITGINITQINAELFYNYFYLIIDGLQISHPQDVMLCTYYNLIELMT